MTEPDGSWQAGLESALSGAEEQLGKLELSRPLRRTAQATISRARQADRDQALELVFGLRSELAALVQLMTDLHEKGIAAERAEAADKPFGEAWLSRLRRRLMKVDSNADWTASVLDAWSFAVAARRWETADKVAEMSRKRQGRALPVDTLIALDGALAQNRWESGIRLIDQLLLDTSLPAATAVRLLVAKARVCLFRLWNPEAALVATEAAVKRAASGPRWSRDLSRAATVEALIELGDLEEAHRLVEGVLEQAVGVPDLLVIAGTLRERVGDHSSAQDLYDAAVLRFGDRATSGWLYAPLTPSFLWRGAVHAWPGDPDRALSLLDEALELAAMKFAEGPEHQPWLYRATVLEQLGRAPEAAAAYHTAARQYDHAGLPALEHYAKAYSLASNERKYAWSYAEALRVSATAAGGTSDVDALRRAQEVLSRSLENHTLDREHAWVLVTSAMIAWVLDEEDALMLAERSVILDPSYARGYAFLALLLREKGLVGPASEAAEAGYQVDWTDPFVTTQLAYARVEAGDFEQSAEVLDSHLSYLDADLEIVMAKACVELWAGRADAAMTTLELAPDGEAPPVAMLVAQCYAALDERDREQEIYRRLAGSGASQTATWGGWVAYRLGHFDEAIDLLGAASDATGHPTGELLVARMDCGQALIARGHDEDVASGLRLLLDGVAACTSVVQLLQLLHPELPLLERRVLRLPGSAADSAVFQVRQAVVKRIESLRSSRLESGTTAHTLAQARVDAGADRQGRALELYLALADQPGLPEIGQRLLSLGQDLLDQGDALLLKRGVSAARSPWQAADRLPRDQKRLQDLLHKIDVRLALADLAVGGSPESQSLERLPRCRGTDLVEIAPRFAPDLSSLRQLLGGLQLAAQAARMPWGGQLSDVQRAVYTALLDHGHDHAVNVSGARYVGAVEMRLSARYAPAYQKGLLDVAIKSLRDKLSAETGIQIPGVKVVLDPKMDRLSARFSVYGSPIPDHQNAVADNGTVEWLLASFEEVLRHNLFRWLSVDDLFLWCSGWQSETDSRDESLLRLMPVTPWGKLQLARLLKMLLREGVPVCDRRAILNAFSRWQKGGGTSLREVYEDLRVLLTKVEDGVRVVALPQSLEQRVAGAMDTEGQVWAAARPDASRLVDDLRGLIKGHGNVPMVVTVQDRAVRSYVWRLLAAERPRVRVVVEGEQS